MIGVYLPVYRGRWHKVIICYTLVDKDLFESLNESTWRLFLNGANNYVYTYKESLRVWLHSKVLGVSGMIDHKNLDTLDNRLENLRVSTFSQNNANRAKYQKNESAQSNKHRQSKYKGVYGNYNKWIARIVVDSTCVNLGSYALETGAALAYNRAAKKYFGDFARLNDVGEV